MSSVAPEYRDFVGAGPRNTSPQSRATAGSPGSDGHALYAPRISELAAHVRRVLADGESLAARTSAGVEVARQRYLWSTVVDAYECVVIDVAPEAARDIAPER
jgi:hypothetical protein